MSFRRTIIALLLAAAALQPLSAQRNRGQTDSVVVLMNAKSLELLESASGMHYRKAIEARFLHNNTYLVCDSALWNVDMRIINAFGNVQIIQDRTVLSSERLDYIIDDAGLEHAEAKRDVADKLQSLWHEPAADETEPEPEGFWKRILGWFR